MDATHRIVRLSAKELSYLRNSRFLPEDLVEVLNTTQSISDETNALHLSNDDAEEFRSALTDHLAKVGFGIDYEPTDEGKILEDLIDRFYRPD
jgi:hypothetical protein